MTTALLLAGGVLAFWLVGALLLRVVGGLYAVMAVGGYFFDSWRLFDTIFGVIIGLALLAAGVAVSDLQARGRRAELLEAVAQRLRRLTARDGSSDRGAAETKRPWQELSTEELHALETAPPKHVIEVRTVQPTIHELIAVDGGGLSDEELWICDDLALDPELVREGLAVMDAMHGDPGDVPNTIAGLLEYAERVGLEHREWIARRTLGPVPTPAPHAGLEKSPARRVSRSRRGHH